jgi:pimeloyl-ACP methyl ester carboxylesterase
VRRLFFALAAAVAGAAALGIGPAGAAKAAQAFARCHGLSGVLCATVTVSLDPSGVTPGSVDLAVEELPATGPSRGVLLMLAGGPGQAGALVFDLADDGGTWRELFPRYTLVAFDPRGTGDSGFLDCDIDPNVLGASAAALVAGCGEHIGPNRVFYSTGNNAADIDAVRRAVGAERIAIWGTSYGTKMALAYALAYPTHVERLLLDSVLPPEGPDPFGLDTLKGIPPAMASLCGGGACKRITSDLAGQVAAVANRLAAKPSGGSVVGPDGAARREVLDGLTFLQLVVASDLNPGLRAELPSAVAAAAAGRTKALLRLERFAQQSGSTGTSFSTALFLSTICGDGRFPWTPETAPGDRRANVDAAVAALPAGATGPFGSWATAYGPASYCLLWPSPAGNAPLGPGPLPDVPVLVLSGGLDMRTPTAGAARVAAGFPRGHLVVVPGVGHSVLTADPSGCAVKAVQKWLAGGVPAAECPRARSLLGLVGQLPATVSAARPAPGTTGLRGRTLALARSTVSESLAALLTSGGAPRGMFGGVARVSGGKVRLATYSDVPGLALSGSFSLEVAHSGALLQPVGIVRVSGKNAASGVIVFANGSSRAVWTKKRG